MTENKNKSGQYTAKETYLLSGLLYCGNCGTVMTGTTRKSGIDKIRYSSYECSTRKKQKTCIKTSIRKTAIESLVLDYMANDIIENIDSIMIHAKTSKDENYNDIDGFKKALDTTQTELDNAINAILNGLLNTVKKIITEDFQNFKTHTENYLLGMKDIKSYEPEKQKQIINMFIKKVIVTDDKDNSENDGKNNKVEIFFKIATLNSGGEENRTPVQSHFLKDIYVRSL